MLKRNRSLPREILGIPGWHFPHHLERNTTPRSYVRQVRSTCRSPRRILIISSRTLPVRSADRTGTHSRPCLLRRLIPVACRFRQQRRTIRHRAAWRISPRRLACRVRVNSVGGSNCRSKQLHSADSETKNVHAARRLFRGARLVLVLKLPRSIGLSTQILQI
jgi:hypothetical protein